MIFNSYHKLSKFRLIPFNATNKTGVALIHIAVTGNIKANFAKYTTPLNK